jgi:methionyl-tRNA formyltransferase
MQIIKIGFFGDGPWAHEALRRLLLEPNVQIKFVCVRFDTPDVFLLELARKNGIETHTLRNVNSEQSLELLQALKADLFVSMSFNQIFKSEIIQLPSLGIINCHAGKLPYYRGRNTLNWALINDEREFGITVHQVDTGIDTGNILVQKTYPIHETDDYGSLLRIAHMECAPLLVGAIGQIRLGESKPLPQHEISVIGTYFPMRIRGDEIIDWNQSSRDVYNFIRALANPGPLAQSHLNGEVIKFQKAQLIEKAPIFKGIPGSVIGVQENELSVKTSDSLILIKEFSASFKPRLGDRFQ